MTKAVIGIIGGSGVYDLPGLENLREEQVTTPWGAPSDALRFGTLGGRDAVFLPRHGRGHRLSPSGINYRANIAALKQAGVTDLVSISACGSYRAELYPGFFVLVDQFVDRTVGRESSFFGNGCVAHVSMAHLVAPLLQRRIAEAAKAEDIAHKVNGTYLCMEGPQFSSYAESMTYKAAGYDVVGMTAMPEAKLAREAELPYATVAMVTDYDNWHEDHGTVDITKIIATMQANADAARRTLSRLVERFPRHHPACPIGSDLALEHAIITPPAERDPDLMARLDAVAGRVLAHEGEADN